MAWLLDLPTQVRHILGTRFGGTGNDRGWAQGTVVRAVVCEDETVGVGMVVRMRGPERASLADDADSTDTLGVVVGIPDEDGHVALTGSVGRNEAVSVMVAGIAPVLLSEDVGTGEYAYPTAMPGVARGETTPGAGSFGVFVGHGITDGTAMVRLGGGGGAPSTSPLTTKGDLHGYDSADARVPVGADGQLLVADATDAQGVTWSEPEAAGLVVTDPSADQVIQAQSGTIYPLLVRGAAGGQTQEALRVASADNQHAIRYYVSPVDTSVIAEGAGSAVAHRLLRYSADTQPPGFAFIKSRGTTVGDFSVVQNGDQLGEIVFQGADGTDVGNRAAVIGAYVDGVPGTNDMPGRISIWTSPDGTIAPVERLRVRSDGAIILGVGGTGPQIRFGPGTPEGAVTAPVGSLYLRTDGGAGTTLYVKQSGAGNTGWAAK